MIRSALIVTLGLVTTATAAPPRPLRGPVQLQARPAVAYGQIAAYPRVLPGPAVPAVVAARINAGLAREQALAVNAARDCNAEPNRAQAGHAHDAWSRTVAVTMRGPAYLALTATDSYDCGGAYPNDDIETSLVYDLATGAPVDWLSLFPKGATSSTDTSGDGARLGFVIWPQLGRRYDAHAQADCEGLFSSGLDATFQITLDARGGALNATPGDLNHATHICATAVAFPAADLRRLGFAPRLAAALEAARRLNAPN